MVLSLQMAFSFWKEPAFQYYSKLSEMVAQKNKKDSISAQLSFWEWKEKTQT